MLYIYILPNNLYRVFCLHLLFPFPAAERELFTNDTHLNASFYLKLRAPNIAKSICS